MAVYKAADLGFMEFGVDAVQSNTKPAISRDSFKRSLKTFSFSAYSCT